MLFVFFRGVVASRHEERQAGARSLGLLPRQVKTEAGGPEGALTKTFATLDEFSFCVCRIW